jgi:AraC-like DNA-binding protein
MKPMKNWLKNVQNYYWLHDVLQIYVGLPLWVIRWDGQNKREWLELTPQTSGFLRPTHFEVTYGRERFRDQYYLKVFKRIIKEKKIIVDQFAGFYDLFIPLAQEGDGFALLYAGFFLREPASFQSIARAWRNLTGREPVGTDPEFLSYVRMTLKIPVLDDPLLNATKQFLQYFTQYVMGNPDQADLHGKVDDLRRNVFAHKIPNSSWTKEALGIEKLVPPPWAWYPDKQLAPWMKEELGITRLPTTVFTLMPVHAGNDAQDIVQTMVRNHQVQQACVDFAHALPETVGEKLQDYGLVFLTSPDPSKNPAQARLQIRERAEKVQQFVKKKFGFKTVVGIGRPVRAGEVLYESYREAVLALHLCVQTDKSLLFYGDEESTARDSAFVGLYAASSALSKACEQGLRQETRLASDRYVREVLEFAGGNVEVVRGQFLDVVFRLLEQSRSKMGFNPDDADNYANYCCNSLLRIDSIQGLIAAFKDLLNQISNLVKSPAKGSGEVRMETVLSYIRNNFDQELKLAKVAKTAGFSVSVFCRVFKKTTGMTFVAYLNKYRVEKAKILLKTSDLSILGVGQACGFSTAHRFIRQFKSVTGRRPSDLR